MVGERARVNKYLIKATGETGVGVLKKKEQISKEEGDSRRWKDGEQEMCALDTKFIDKKNKDAVKKKRRTKMESRKRGKNALDVIFVFLSFFRHISLGYCEFSDR